MIEWTGSEAGLESCTAMLFDITHSMNIMGPQWVGERMENQQAAGYLSPVLSDLHGKYRGRIRIET